jgi:hypothetical protein
MGERTPDIYNSGRQEENMKIGLPVEVAQL